MNLLLGAIIVGTMTVTSYRSVPEQTDTSPYITSIGERVSIRGCAVSPDLLKGGLKYGDLIYIEGIGFRFVNDTTNSRLRRHVDVWVATYADEKKIGVRKHINVWVIKGGLIGK